MDFRGLERTGVSVVIIAFNAEKRIRPTIQHLANQKEIYFDWEVILVDNNSTDNTGEVAEKTWENCGSPCPLTIIKEKKQGAMFARVKGMEHSNYKYLLFCDDDNWLPENYVKNAFQRIDSSKDIAAVGGRGISEFESDFEEPEWINKYEHMLGCGSQGEKDGDTTNDKGCLYTAGAIFDKIWLDKLYSAGFNSFLTGRNGKSLQAGEDTELTYALKLMGGRLHYYSEMKFKHYMPAERIKWPYLLKLSRAIGSGNYLLKPYKNQKEPNIFKKYLFTSGLIIKYFFKSLINGFEEGDENTIYLHRFIGRFGVLKKTRKNYKKINKVIEKLTSYYEKQS